MKYRIFVLTGAICYGILSTIVKLTYGEGYRLGEVVGSQLLTGCMLAWSLFAIVRWRSGQRMMAPVASSGRTEGRAYLRPSWRQCLLLMAAGVPSAVTGLLYYESLRYIPNSLAILLLFQFTWMGVMIQALLQRRLPDRLMLLTLVVLLGGTLLAAGVLQQDVSTFHWYGVLLGFLSAISYTLLIIISGQVVTGAHPVTRSAWMISGGLLFVFILFPPRFLVDGTLWSGLLPYGFSLGLLGAFLPPLLFAYGVPKIGEGLTSVIGAAELPVAVLLSSVVLHEQVTLVQWGGVLLVLLGVAMPEWMRHRRAGLS